jgi:hypothetical protein
VSTEAVKLFILQKELRNVFDPGESKDGTLSFKRFVMSANFYDNASG